VSRSRSPDERAVAVSCWFFSYSSHPLALGRSKAQLLRLGRACLEYRLQPGSEIQYPLNGISAIACPLARGERTIGFPCSSEVTRAGHTILS
jgi:hypothetical protein